MRRALFFTLLITTARCCACAQFELRPPGATRYAQIGRTVSILPGGRIIQPEGLQLETGPAPLALAVSPRGVVAAADCGPERFGITVLEQAKTAWSSGNIWARTPGATIPETADPSWKGVSRGIAFASDRAVWISEGASGRVRLLDINSKITQKTIDLNDAASPGSATADLAFDPARRLLVVVDSAHARLVVLDTAKGRVLSSLKLERTPSALSLSPDRRTVWLASLPDLVSAVNISDPAHPVVAASLHVADPRSVLAVGDRVYVSSGHDDSIAVFNAADQGMKAEIPLRIQGLATLRGILPAGMAFDPLTKWLLVAESGINAVAVIDTEKNVLLGHVPTGWFPTAVAVAGDRVFVANQKGRGTGPFTRYPVLETGEMLMLHRGTVSTFVVPAASELPRLSGIVYAANGFIPHPAPAEALPDAIKYVVVIREQHRTFDEVLGDLAQASNGPVAAMPKLARLGMHGVASGNRQRFSVQDVPITPNQHALAERWSLSDNFYSDGEIGWPELALQKHLEQNGVTFRTADPSSVPALAASETFAQFTLIDLQKDEHAPGAHPYEASQAAESDTAVGQIIERLSQTQFWPRMVVFVAAGNGEGGLDHVDSHRIPLVAAGPWVRHNYASHLNTGFPALLKTALELLHAPPFDLNDASAATLRDIFTTDPDYRPYAAIPPDKRMVLGGHAEPE